MKYIIVPVARFVWMLIGYIAYPSIFAIYFIYSGLWHLKPAKAFRYVVDMPFMRGPEKYLWDGKMGRITITEWVYKNPWHWFIKRKTYLK